MRIQRERIGKAAAVAVPFIAILTRRTSVEPLNTASPTKVRLTTDSSIPLTLRLLSSQESLSESAEHVATVVYFRAVKIGSAAIKRMMKSHSTT